MDKHESIQQILSVNGYYYIDLIGSGSFADVYLCQNSKYNHFFAIKRVLKKKLAQLEIEALISLIHPYIVKLYQTFSYEDYQYLVMEYCPNGTIKQLGKLNYKKFVFYAKQLLEVLDYCHSQKIAHRDIKPDNIFIDHYNQAKLGDFGLANKFQENDTSNEKCGSIMFCSPEIITSSQFDPFKADIWALGITFYYMVTGHYPFPDCSNEDLKNHISFGQIDFSHDEVDTKIQHIIMKMTTKNPLFRPSAHQLLKFPLFSSQVSTKLKQKINSSSLLSFKSRKSCSHFTFYDTKNSPIPPPESENADQKHIKLSKIHSFRSLNFNIPTTTYQHYIKYD